MSAPDLHLQICLTCMTWHPAPVPCDHDIDKPCVSCGGKRGYRVTGDDARPYGDGRTCGVCVLVEMGLAA